MHRQGEQCQRTVPACLPPEQLLVDLVHVPVDGLDQVVEHRVRTALAPALHLGAAEGTPEGVARLGPCNQGDPPGKKPRIEGWSSLVLVLAQGGLDAVAAEAVQADHHRAGVTAHIEADGAASQLLQTAEVQLQLLQATRGGR